MAIITKKDKKKEPTKPDRFTSTAKGTKVLGKLSDTEFENLIKKYNNEAEEK